MQIGFLIQPSYRLEGGRAVLHLHGRLETGRPFLIREDRFRPYCFARLADLEAARKEGARVEEAAGFRTLRGEPVCRLVFQIPADLAAARSRLAESGVPLYEADIRFPIRFLIDRGIRGGIAIEGSGRSGERGEVIFENPQIGPAEHAPGLSWLSLDLETDPRAQRIYSAALHGPAAAEVLLLLPPQRGAGGERESAETLAIPHGTFPFRVLPFRSERELLAALLARIREIDPDVLTGWNVIDFDLSVIERRCRALGVASGLGRAPGELRIRKDSSYYGSSRAEAPGRAVLDAMQLLKGSFVRLEDYKLETAARTLLGEGKVLGPAHTAEDIERCWREDLPRFLHYNFTDARLVSDILGRTRLLPLAVRRSLLTGMPLERVGASIAAFDFLYLGELRRRGFVAPTAAVEEPAEPTIGGAVLDPRPGLYENILVLDYRSLYPSIIRTFNIDPITWVQEPSHGEADLIRAPNGACFRRDPGILPAMLDRLFPERERARREGDEIASQAIKILMNSFFGVLAAPGCRFAIPAVANAITSFGQAILFWTRERVEGLGYEVLYGDTDSIFVRSSVADPMEALQMGERLAARLNGELASEILNRHRVESRLSLEFQTLFRKLFLPTSRGETAGSKKRYAGLTLREPGRGGEKREEIVFVGLESVRRDWTRLARNFQQELIRRVFAGEPLEPYIRGLVREVREGRHDALLVYRKALRKRMEEYTETTPPHVKAARKLSGKPGRSIEYVVTLAGPEPVGQLTAPPDYEHYIDRQLAPIADAVLVNFNTSFQEVLGEGRQLALF